MYSIEVENLIKKYHHFTAVDNVSFTVKRGEIFGFLGANGAGKTTTIKMLCGLLQPTSGKAVVAGFDIKKDYKNIKKNIGYMSQRFSLYADLSLYENMQLFGTIYGIPRKELKDRIFESLEHLQMTDKAHVMVYSIPLGWKQKLAFATAMLHQPKIVFLDEPTSGVDPMVRREFWNMLYEAADKGVTIFVTTHYMDEAEYCERISIMDEGKLQLVGTPAQLKNEMSADTIAEVFQKIVKR